MLPKQELGFNAQRAALAQMAEGPATSNYAQAMQSANGLLGGAMEKLHTLGQTGGVRVNPQQMADAIRAYGESNPIEQKQTPKMAGSMPEGDIEQYIYRGLLDRGFTDIQARGSILNFKDESGLKADIVEGAPNVHGTRGQGLYQLTDIKPGQGRRTDYLNFLSTNKRDDAWSIDSQLDFYKWETENTEKGSWAKFANAATVGEFGAGMVSNFLRPAREHVNSRSARYLAIG